VNIETEHLSWLCQGSERGIQRL
ncbi:hypothetical protein MPH_14231, partial [Macrophomina phaseolina MS6]